MTPYLVHQFLERSAAQRPGQAALVHEDERTTYAELEAGANRIARALLSATIRRGDRVGLLCLNSRLYAQAYYGILKAGAIAVPLNTAADGPTVRGFMSDCGARALIVGPRLEKVAAEAAAALPDLTMLLTGDPARTPSVPAHIAVLGIHEAAAAESPEPPGLDLVDLDLASIIYTSGSTGRPRGATLSHLNLCANTRSIVQYLQLTPDDRVCCVLPFYYVYGKSLLNTHVAAGGSVAIENRFLFPNTALDTLEKEQCTGFSGVPSTFAILLNRSNLVERKLAHLRYVTQAGGAMSPELIRRLIAALPGKRVFIMYGATEAGARLSWLDPDVLSEKVGSIGRAIPNVELRVLREDGTEAAVDEPGEIVARGANIMRGYWGDSDETAKVLDAHGYHTGDLGRRDADGYLWVVGRKKDMIKSGAHRVAAREIEDAILEFPDVHETAVIGVPDELLGEAIRAFVVFRAGVAAGIVQELEKFLKKKLPSYKVPSSFEVRDDLPKNDSGKIMKNQLR